MKNNYFSALRTKPMEKLSNRSKGLAPLNLSKVKSNMLLFDTETIGDITKGEKAFPYDVSFINIFKRSITHKIAYINKDIYDNDYLMNNAFYKNKIPFYNEKLKTDSNYKKVNDKELLLNLNSFIKENKIKYFLAFNVKFDYMSINNLYDKVGVKNEFKKLRLIDIWKIATDMLEMFKPLYESYMLFCYKNNYITESGKNVKTSAETFNRWVNNDLNFIENHTGLEDTFCEYNILLKLLWYYEKHTGESYYYKLDSVFSPSGKIFNNGIFNVERLENIINKYEIMA